MTAPLLHWPTPLDLAIDALIAVGSLVPVFLYVWFRLIGIGIPTRLFLRFAPPLVASVAPRPLVEFVVYLVAIDCTRHDLHPIIMVAYVAWCIWGRWFPWDKMKKKLGSTISSMTEVAKASFQRQQSEAFS